MESNGFLEARKRSELFGSLDYQKIGIDEHFHNFGGCMYITCLSKVIPVLIRYQKKMQVGMWLNNF